MAGGVGPESARSCGIHGWQRAGCIGPDFAADAAVPRERGRRRAREAGARACGFAGAWPCGSLHFALNS
jgi:hypothetical protein